MNNKELFSVSIKGIVEKDGSFLVRRNQRNEFELLGGRLEQNDSCAEERLKTEFLEESGMEVNVVTHREPWLYIIAKKNIIIVPYICSIEKMPSQMIDQDGGSLHWIKYAALDAHNIPKGYVDSIRNRIPRKSFSLLPGEYFRTIPNYTERDYYIKIVVKNLDGGVLLDDYLPRFMAPRALLKERFAEGYDNDSFVPLNISKCEDEISLNYLLIK